MTDVRAVCDAWKRHSRAVFPVGLVLLAAAELVVSATVTDDSVRLHSGLGYRTPMEVLDEWFANQQV
ncbi:hypothetical protein ACFQ1S_43535, partial [Kibdelosporangium lantanae]